MEGVVYLFFICKAEWGLRQTWFSTLHALKNFTDLVRGINLNQRIKILSPSGSLKKILLLIIFRKNKTWINLHQLLSKMNNHFTTRSETRDFKVDSAWHVIMFNVAPHSIDKVTISLTEHIHHRLRLFWVAMA